MFEYDKYEDRLHADAPASPGVRYEAATNIAEMSLLAWGEHCVECAAPACFQTCDLYQRRPDGRCRRFTFGMYKNEEFPCLRGCGAEISFKKWAKIEARGNTSMTPVRSLLRNERFIELCAPVVNMVGSVGYTFTRDLRWSHLTHSLLERLGRWLHRKDHNTSKPDAFLLEVYNPMSETIRMQLTMSLARGATNDHSGFIQIAPSFTTTVEFKYGYTRHEFDRRLFQKITESGLPFDIALIPEADTSARLIFLTADFVTYDKKKQTTQRPDIKCIVWDLDDTLWDGVLLEKENVVLKPGILELFTKLDGRGILLSVASKNDHSHAWQQLKQCCLDEYLLYPQINWMPKSQSIKLIAERLNIGLDTFAFVDDNPFELEQVSLALPTVTCINIKDIDGLLENPRFKGSSSEDAKNRRRYYKETLVREEKQAEFGADYLGFLASSNIRLDVNAYQSEYFDRVIELAQRTNQLNFSGTKYTRDQISEVLKDETRQKYVLTCSDKYGSYGIVGFSIVSNQATEIRVEDFMLSCRVQAKFIEQAFFDYLQRHQNPSPASRLWVNFRKTGRNKPAQQVLESLHFEECESGGVWLDLSAHPLECHFIQVNASSIYSDRNE